MKKILLYAMMILCLGTMFTACHKHAESTPAIPPTAEDILGTYSADKLILTVEGAEAGAEPKVEVIKGGSETTVNMLLTNVVPGSAEYTVNDVKFETTTQSPYYGKLTGEAVNNMKGFTVSVSGKVDEGVLSLTVKMIKIEGEPITNASELFSTYKGDLQVSLSGTPAGKPVEQRVYASEASKSPESALKFAIKNISFGDQPGNEVEIGSIEFDDIPVVKRGDIYAFEVAERDITVKVDNLDMALKTNVNGTILEGKLVLSVDLYGQGVEINVAFDGKAVTEKTEAKILGYSFENGEAITEIQTEGGGASLSLYFWDDVPTENLLITPKLELSEGASITKIEGYYNSETNVLEVGKPIDFSLFKGANDYIRYTVQAEDPSFTSTGTLYPRWLKNIQLTHEFASMNWFTPESQPYTEPTGWATSNSTTTLLHSLGLIPTGIFPVSQNDENAAKIITMDTKGMDTGIAVIPAIASGTLFLGTFEIDSANPLKSTKFGVPFKQRPTKLAGEYKYNAGNRYYKTVITDKENGKNVVKEEVSGKTDEFSINAILYEVANYSETLDGANIYSSDKVVATALLSDGSVADWTIFELNFEYVKSFDASKKYKLAIICSSSKYGNSFEGAPESELVVKSLSIMVD